MSGWKAFIAGVVLACLAGAGVQVLLSPRTTRSAAAPVPERPDARIARLEAAVARLEAGLRELDRPAPIRELPPVGVEREEVRDEPVPPPAPERERRSPLECLERYAESFETSPGGSSYYRRRVEDFAAELFEAIAERIADRRQVLPLRIALVDILSDPRFGGEPGAVSVLLRAVQHATSLGEIELGKRSLRGLVAIGDGTTAKAIEAFVWRLPHPALREAAIEAIVRLDPAPNRALERLLGAAPTDADRIAVLERLDVGHEESAVDLLRLATLDGVPVRTTAARITVQQHGSLFQDFVDEWLGWEAEEQVREILQSGRERMMSAPPYAPAQALGPPNAALGSDDPRAWAYQETQGLHWIELAFEPRRASALRLHVNHAPGGIARIVLRDTSGAEITAFDGSDPCTTPGPCEFRFRTPGAPVASARILLDADRVHSWCEIDAAELVGPDGSGWATAATASSYYGGGIAVPWRQR